MQRKDNRKELKRLGLFFLFGIFLVSFVSAQSCALSVSLVNQDPYPAIPGDYVDVVFQVDGIENSDCEGAVFDLDVSYPFLINENDTFKTLEGSTYVSKYKTEWMIPYTLKVDSDAYDGNSTLTVKYGQEETFLSTDFDIVIQDSRTSFDAVIQEVSGIEVSIAIANAGEYTANSVVVRIPEQESFRTTETNGQMVGNLDAGDYTIVSFTLNSAMQRNMQSGDNIDKTNFQQNQKDNLEFDIYYTDALGERRIVNMELPLQMSSTLLTENGEMPAGFAGRMGRQQEESGTNWTLWIILGIVIIVGFVLYKKYPKQKFTELFHKKKHSDNTSNAIPAWINNAKEKEKKK